MTKSRILRIPRRGGGLNCTLEIGRFNSKISDISGNPI